MAHLRTALRLGFLVVVEVAALVVLLVVVATVVIPLSAPASIPTRARLPVGMVLGCPPRIPGCR